MSDSNKSLSRGVHRHIQRQSLSDFAEVRRRSFKHARKTFTNPAPAIVKPGVHLDELLNHPERDYIKLKFIKNIKV